MNPIIYIARFELYYHLRRPITYVFALLITLQALWYSLSLYEYYANDRVLLNSPANMYLVMASLGMVITAVASILAGQSLTKDLDHKTTGYVYALPVTDKSYFIGKFLGTYATVLLLSMFYPLGTLLLPVFFPAKTGSVSVGQLIDAFLWVVPQNVLFVTGLAFAMTVFTRRMIGAYMAMLALVAYFLLMESNREAAYESDLLILDPFCFGVIKNAVDALSTAEKNTGYLSFGDFFIINRLLWLGIGMGILVRAESRFSFQEFAGLKSSPKNTTPFWVNWLAHLQQFTAKKNIQPQAVLPVADKLSSLNSSRAGGGSIRQLLWLTYWEIRQQLQQTLFRIGIIIVGLLTVLYAYLYQHPNTEFHPLALTQSITALRHPLGICISLFLLVLTGELVYREQTSHFNLIYDSLPHRNWVTLLAKLLAVSSIAVLLTICIGLAGLSIQIIDGFGNEIDWSLLAHDLVADGLVGYLQRIIFALFVAVLVNNRYVGHLVTITLYLIAVVAHEVGLTEGVRFLYSFLPGSTQYSAMSGYGVFALAQPVYQGLWWGVAGLVLTLAIWFQLRGVSDGVGHRIRQWKYEFSWPYALALTVFGLLTIGSQWQIWQQLYKTGNSVSKADSHHQAAAYESHYSYLKQRPQPRITNLDLHLDLFPSQRRLNYQATLQVANQTSQRIDTLFLSYLPTLTKMTLQLGQQKLLPLFNDSTRYVAAYAIRLNPNQQQTLLLTARQQYKGFSTANPQADLSTNGTLTNVHLLPTIGYDDSRELTDNHDRLTQGLAKRAAVLPVASDWRGLSRLSQGTTGQAYPYRITVSTEHSQTALAPGQLMKQWQQNGRQYTVFEQKQPAPDNWRIASAQYQAQSRKVTLAGQVVKVRLFYQHGYNLPLFWQAINDALRQGSRVFGPYPYPELRLAEVPLYNDPILSMPGQITIAENQGWLAATKTTSDKVYALLTRAVLKQWLENSLPTARVQGAGFLQQGLVEYLTIQAVAKRYGTQRQIQHLAQALNAYRKSRNVEDAQEMTLLNADGDTYLERHKAALVLSSIGQVWGDDKLTHFIGTFYRQTTDRHTAPLVTANDFATQLTRQLPDTLQYMTGYLANRFNYDLMIGRIDERSDEIGVNVMAAKWNDDGLGNGKPLPIQDHVVLAVLDANGHELERRMFFLGPNEPPVWFPKLPGAREVVVDPLGAWLDVQPKNNRKLLAGSEVVINP